MKLEIFKKSKNGKNIIELIKKKFKKYYRIDNKL